MPRFFGTDRKRERALSSRICRPSAI